MRNKKEKNVETRLEELFGDVVFSRLREQRPNFAEKIVTIEGDCEFPELGLSTQDKNRLMKEVVYIKTNNIILNILSFYKTRWT